MNRRTFQRLAGTGLIAACLALSFVAPCSAQQDPKAPGISKRRLPPSTTDGIWDGTWYYMNREAKLALWFRTEGDTVKVKLQYLDLADAESFGTDWEGQADYAHRGSTGTMSIRLNETDPNRLAGSWNWELKNRVSSRVETGKFQMFRSVEGRSLIMAFEDLTRKFQGKRTQEVAMDAIWTFRKASRRHVVWGELPF